VHELTSLMRQAIQRRMVSDVPFGVLAVRGGWIPVSMLP